MKIRCANRTDLETVREITLMTIKAVYPRYYPCGAVDFFVSHHNDESILSGILSGSVFLLETEEAAAGTVTVKGNEIHRLFVLPSYHGKGYGGALLDFSERTVFKQHDRVTLSASLPSKGIYLGRGYVETSSHTVLTENGDFLFYDTMEKLRLGKSSYW